MKWAVLLTVLALAACGVDGEPRPQQGGISIDGDVRVGVTGTL